MKYYESNQNECINELHELEQVYKNDWSIQFDQNRLKRIEDLKRKQALKAQREQDRALREALKEVNKQTLSRTASILKIKKDIKVFPLEHASKKDYAGWIFPQILAHFGSKKLVFKDGFVSPTLTLQNWDLDPLEKTWLERITSSPRSLFLESSKNPRYSQSVPLALSAFKTYQNVSYETWDFSDLNIKTFLEPLHSQLLPLRTKDLPDPVTLDWKNLEKKLDSWFSFGEWEADTLGSLPRLAVHIYTQTWLWHPSKIHSLAIQSLKNWDHAEKSLHQSNIFVSI